MVDQWREYDDDDDGGDFFSVIAHGLVCNVCSIKVGDWNKILKNMHGWQYNVLAKKWFHANQIVVLNMIRSNLYKVFWFQCDNQLHMKWEIILYACHVMDTKKFLPSIIFACLDIWTFIKFLLIWERNFVSLFLYKSVILVIDQIRLIDIL